MGSEIETSVFQDADFDQFKRNLRKETSLLNQWAKDGAFETDDDCHVMGLEIESWIVDRDFRPNPINHELLEKINHPDIVPELSKFNLEINADPAQIEGSCFSSLHEALKKSWQLIQSSADQLDSHAMMIGSLPTLRDHMLTLDQLSDGERYKALNNQVLHLRKGAPLSLEFEGRDYLKVVHNDIMLEAAATSLQIHLQPPFARYKDYFNASIVSSFATVALAANSPYVFGHDLWDESRIAIFEQAVNLPSIIQLDGHYQRRVTFGNRYLEKSFLDLFLENLNGYPVLLPMVYETGTEWLSHLRLHNGNIWRWNRPIIGVSKTGKPHIRIEQRTPAAGPTLVDTVANVAFYLGLVRGLCDEGDPTEKISFEDAKKNFYAAAKKGLLAEVVWENEKGVLGDLISDKLLPMAQKGLEKLGVNQGEIDLYLNEVIKSRCLSGQTGALWQRKWVKKHGPDFPALTSAYFSNQEEGLPVHQWTV